MSITIRDVAKLAGVGTTTVSRVANGASNVSDETRTKVLTAISRLQYCPNSHAINLRHANGDDNSQSRVHLGALGGTRAKPPSHSVSDSKSANQRKGRLPFLEDEYKRMGRAIAELAKDLEKLSNDLEKLQGSNQLHEQVSKTKRTQMKRYSQLSSRSCLWWAASLRATAWKTSWNRCQY